LGDAPAPTSVSLEPLMTAEQVAAVLGVSRKRVYELPIPSVRISPRAIRWRPSDVQRWLADRTAA
jgi:predicted DNA-binding transcriptional regulator AlpA